MIFQLFQHVNNTLSHPVSIQSFESVFSCRIVALCTFYYLHYTYTRTVPPTATNANPRCARESGRAGHNSTANHRSHDPCVAASIEDEEVIPPTTTTLERPDGDADEAPTTIRVNQQNVCFPTTVHTPSNTGAVPLLQCNLSCFGETKRRRPRFAGGSFRCDVSSSQLTTPYFRPSPTLI